MSIMPATLSRLPHMSPGDEKRFHSSSQCTSMAYLNDSITYLVHQRSGCDIGGGSQASRVPGGSTGSESQVGVLDLSPRWEYWI